GVIRATSSASSYLRRVGRKTIPPSLSRASATQSPSLRLACLAIARGIRTARLFPHFETVVSFRMCIYFEDTSDSHAIQARHAQLPHSDVLRLNRTRGSGENSKPYGDRKKAARAARRRGWLAGGESALHRPCAAEYSYRQERASAI